MTRPCPARNPATGDHHVDADLHPQRKAVERFLNRLPQDLLSDDRIPSQHYAFAVPDQQGNEIFERLKARGLDYWADPFHRLPGEINTEFGGRGVYFEDPNGHSLEIMTPDYELQ